MRPSMSFTLSNFILKNQALPCGSALTEAGSPYAHTVEAVIAELAIENGVQFFAEQQLETQRTNARTLTAAPRALMFHVLGLR